MKAITSLQASAFQNKYDTLELKSKKGEIVNLSSETPDDALSIFFTAALLEDIDFLKNILKNTTSDVLGVRAKRKCLERLISASREKSLEELFRHSDPKDNLVLPDDVLRSLSGRNWNITLSLLEKAPVAVYHDNGEILARAINTKDQKNIVPVLKCFNKESSAAVSVLLSMRNSESVDFAFEFFSESEKEKIAETLQKRNGERGLFQFPRIKAFCEKKEIIKNTKEIVDDSGETKKNIRKI